MMCMEVVLNGSPVCIVGSDEIGAFSALLYSTTDFKEISLMISGLFNNQHVDWVGPTERIALSLGDELTFRFVEAAAADIPRPGDVGPIGDWDPYE